jgi:hypothetical protein
MGMGHRRIGSRAVFSFIRHLRIVYGCEFVPYNSHLKSIAFSRTLVLVFALPNNRELK